MKLEVLLPKVRDLILNSKSDRFTKEAVSVHFNVRESLIEQCFHKLNLEGLVEQAAHGAPHDSTRDYMGWGNDSAWQGDSYWVTEKAKNLRGK
jgi:hypothetical protein